jgi:predicted dehydrogenase
VVAEPPRTVTRVLVVGLGTIARTHLAVLSRLPSVEVVAGVEPAPTYDVPFPVVSTLDEGLALEPELVVLTTPTESHVTLADVLLSSTSALVLSEKPLAQSAAEIAGLESRHSPEVVAARLKVAHHFAFSPEVEWAAQLVAGHPEWGPPSRVVAMSTDAYGGALTDDRRASLVSSFVDSAPNQLSVASAFTQGWRVISHSDQGTRAVTVMVHDGGRTVLSSNWLAGDSSKHTTLEFLGGEVRVEIEHSSMTVLVIEGDRVTGHTAYADTVERKQAHYLGLYDALLHRSHDPRLGVGLALRIARLLEEASALPASDVDWREVTA